MLTTTHEIKPKNRLIVLMPDALFEDSGFSFKIRGLAQAEESDVLYLAFGDAGAAPGMLPVTARPRRTANWLDTLRRVYQPGDQIVCTAEQTLPDGLLRTAPVADLLHAKLDAPVITLSGFYRPEPTRLQIAVNALITWIVFIAILAVCTFLEFRLDHALTGALRKGMLVIIVFLEIAAIFAWDQIRRVR